MRFQLSCTCLFVRKMPPKRANTSMEIEGYIGFRKSFIHYANVGCLSAGIIFYWDAPLRFITTDCLVSNCVQSHTL